MERDHTVPAPWQMVSPITGHPITEEPLLALSPFPSPLEPGPGPAPPCRAQDTGEQWGNSKNAPAVGIPARPLRPSLRRVSPGKLAPFSRALPGYSGSGSSSQSKEFMGQKSEEGEGVV